MADKQADRAGRVRLVEVDCSSSGQRLDNFLRKKLKGVPKSHLYRIVRTGQVRINKGRCKPEYRLQEGDIVRIPPVKAVREPKKPGLATSLNWLQNRILYEDDDLLVIDKPAGLAVHGGSGVNLGLIEAMRQLRPKARFLELVHRLDRDTSGCLLLAKRRPALRAVHAQLRQGQVQKRYTALLKGVWPGRAQRVEVALEKSRLRSGERLVSVSEEGKAAASRFIPKRSFAPRENLEAGAALVEIVLLTGRTHQARVHAAHLGQPIAGDPKYGDREFNAALRALGLKRQFLHAASIQFSHPQSDCKTRIEAPLPEDLQQLLERLEHAKPL